MVFVLFLFLANFLIFMGPMMLMGISQIRGYEPGDAEWGVNLGDVRGQAEAKEEVRRVVTLWQSGEAFERAGGKRERGLLFLGAPGTGKTMLAKAIATGFNSPFVSIPGSGFAQTFIGIDALIVRFLARKAKKLARKWGGQCIVFIDEIDAVGMRRAALGQGKTTSEDLLFFGPNGAVSASGDVVIETRAWRERMFEHRAPESRSPYAPWMQKVGNLANQGIFPGMMGGQGQLALNQLLVVMDGIDNPPFMRRFGTNRINSFLDAVYIVPRRIGKVSLRLPPPRPLGAQIYFIGATNVPIERLDPALTRPGRMGRHVWFRTPTKDDRVDVFDLYLGKVAHAPELDTPEARDELARMTNGYSPAMIDQVCSMALTYAQHDGRVVFSRSDLVEAMTTIESGTAIGVESVPDELRATAVHEAGHALASHVYQKNIESTRLSVKMRGGSLGHFYGIQQEERFSRWRSEDIASLTMLLGAMAAEHVFYGENTNGVGGDVQSTTALAAYMVGASAMAPEPITITKKVKNETEEETRERIMKRFEKIGVQIMNRTGGGGPFAADPIAGVLNDRDKRAMAAQIIGQAYIRAYHLMLSNKPAIETIADTLVEKREMYGNEVVAAAEEPAGHRSRGRPACGGDMATDLTSSEGAEPAKAEAPLVVRPPSPPAASAQPHRHRFRAIYAVLGLALAAAIARRRRLRRPRDQPGARLVGVETDGRRSRCGEADRGPHLAELPPSRRQPARRRDPEGPGSVVGRPDDPDSAARRARPEGEDPARPREAADEREHAHVLVVRARPVAARSRPASRRSHARRSCAARSSSSRSTRSST